ncbi:hypothetical protein [Streptomyces sp. VRA16 Mangrove soil]|uniref:ATP-binding protein n=1 Tax=Streptomyces sp. VRA16 Mangrove soil TaxID=2817434 RepID=UPI001A9DE3F0|nr:hypothetical protein [Streptomyces sp. VRA16 Mangrove soil]MBO1333589.1 hypothetical protein [Streptomyces sp. VRA16 Mangrove soil]
MALHDDARDDGPAGHLVGRGRELAALLSRLATSRLVSLTGLPGVGRTRLAREAAGQLRREVVWESGAGYEPEMLPGVGARLRHRCAGRRGMLLVLDDWDHLGGAGTALVASLLLDLPHLTVLVVAERPCHLRGETAVVLRPLAVPPPGCPPEEARRYEAVELLRAVLGEAAVDRDPRAAAELCRRFGGVPGTLLAAAGDAAGAGGTRDAVGAGDAGGTDGTDGTEGTEGTEGAGDAGDVVPGLGAAARSHARCSRVERVLWRRLAVFAGEFGREAVREVCGGGPLPAGQVLDILDRIAPHVLIHDPETDRYRLPPAQRAVGVGELAESGERWSTVFQHRRWALGVARQAAEWWNAGRQDEAVALALRELPELRAAMDPATAPLSPHVEAATAVDVVVHLWFLWAACGRTAEGRDLLRHALSLHQEAPPARALWLAAWLELDLGAPEAADPLLTAAWAAAVREGDEHCLGLLAHLRGSVALWQGRSDAAARDFHEAVARVGDATHFGPGPQQCRAALALALVRTDPDAALEVAQDGPGHPGGARDVWAEAWLRYVRAEALRWVGDADSAHTLARSALRTFLGYGSTVGGRCAAELLADVTAMRGEGERAAQLLGAVDALRAAAPPMSRAPYLDPVRRRAEQLLEGLLPVERRAAAYERGARLGLVRILDGDDREKSRNLEPWGVGCNTLPSWTS